MGIIANGWPPLPIFISQAGGELVNEDLTQSPINCPEALEGLEFYLQLAFNTEVAPDQDMIAQRGFREMFVSGDVAMYMGNADEDLDRIEGLNVGVVRVPGYPGTGDHTTYAWTFATVINANVPDVEATCKALLAVTEAVQNWKIVSPRISQNTVEHLVMLEPRKEASAESIVEAAFTMRTYRVFRNFPAWSSALWDEFLTPLINGDISETEVAEAMDAGSEIDLVDFADAVRSELEKILEH